MNDRIPDRRAEERRTEDSPHGRRHGDRRGVPTEISNPFDGFAFGATGADPLPADAPSILIAAADCIGNRAAERDHASGERSMRRAVAMFNAWREGAGPLGETEGWVFMALLKLARTAGGAHRLDDYVDGAAYIALAGESAELATRYQIK